PELTTLADKAPEGDGWLHEIKFDGYRALARIEHGKVRLLTRYALDWTARYGTIAAALESLPVKTAYLDGEIVVIDSKGVSSFAALQESLKRTRTNDLTYQVFDILHLDGKDLTGLPLVERKRVLKALLARLPRGTAVRYSDHVQGDGAAFCKHAYHLG